MYSSSEATANNKRAALDQLRFHKKQRTGPLNVAGSLPSSSGSTNQLGLALPPSQSRDATISSRYFSSTAPSMGTVLVPDSSPLSSDTNQGPNKTYNTPTHVYDVATASGLIHSNAWARPSGTFRVDSLIGPSGFVSNGSSVNASFHQAYGIDDRPVVSIHERWINGGGPPQDPANASNSPGSPEIQRAGQRRRIINNSIDGIATSSDESMPDVSHIAGPSKPRIVRGRPPSSSETSPFSNPLSDPKFTRFKVTMPEHSPAIVQTAWVHANGDVKKATEFLSDPHWNRTPPVGPHPEDVGRVQEIEEANKAQRAAVKEKGKKSMIYANRPVLENKAQRVSTPPPPIPAIDLTASSPISPVVAPPRRKRLKKLVLDSESEHASTDSDEERNQVREHQDSSDLMRALEYFNSTGPEALQELTGCTPEQANAIIQRRPFESIEDLNAKLCQGKKKAGPAGISPRIFEDCTAIFREYGAVDSILEDCEKIGATLRSAIASWTPTPSSGRVVTNDNPSTPTVLPEAEDGALSLRSLASLKEQKPKDYLVTQPSLLSDTVQLKEYQLIGVNWLQLLYRRNFSCILADEMGLGKTIQVISFFAHLKERGNKGPHLVVVPSSTLENWCREFARFAPSISVQTYYAGKEERVELRQTLLDSQRINSKNGEGWEVLITTYNLAQGDDRDRKFFRRVQWDSCVFDEGHVLKNFQSQRYQSLLKFGSKWRLLLTGTPLQNNLQELVSLMNFILPHQFAGTMGSLRTIFRVKGDSKVTLLSQERVSRAKKMMTPFVLRRRKDQVLNDLPKKTERIEWCEMTALQSAIYADALQRSRKTIFDLEMNNQADDTETPPSERSQKKLRTNAKSKNKMYLENSSNVLMDLRKAASHPMLFRTRFTDDILSGITKQLLKEPDFKKRGALFSLVKEDMSVMTDAELQVFCSTYKSTRKYLQDEECYTDAGKVQTLLKLLAEYSAEGRKVLIFSQFTQILDILQVILKRREIVHLVLTGSTPVDVRQSLVDEFTEVENISVFLLSTRAGGMGINLAAASVVIMFDQDFNPHNDRQAQDRAYRIGQKRDVEVVKLISRGTVEEDMLRLGETKLALDEAVAGDGDDKGADDSAPEREMKTSLMNVLRQQFEKQHEGV